MPRRRRPRCKVNPSIALRKKNQESAASRAKGESPPPPPPPPPPDPPGEEQPDPPSEEPPEATSSSSGDAGNEMDYKLFPELYDRQPPLPTFADVFGQPSYGMMLQGSDLTTPPSTSQAAGIRSTPDGKFSNIPSTMLGDRFGIIGLLAAIRTTQTDPSATQLVFGEDLTTYGLDLATQGDIYVHFNGPLTREPPERSSMNCALELGMRAMRDSMDRYPQQPPSWDPLEPDPRHLGLLVGVPQDQGKKSERVTKKDPPTATGQTRNPKMDPGRSQES
ncbi:uncharacterized protein LOC122320750 [Drosophila ficusphila]|uniref:uncharacterized protein LOC122320750 n=1 Tax=Drosophila ficusphila TaxID=30025 RepID=UPI001C8932B9|nr:uncharacterized protein LOC122320750 [Drosophila ficusphila]